MKKTGAFLARYAMEQIGIHYTFGIPGVHNTELYDELNKSEQIEPILVSHEAGAAFMADAVARTSDKGAALVIVPAAGVAYAAAGIGEAFLDGIPMLVFCGGVRTDIEYENQLHQMDQHAFIKAFCKQTYKPETHQQIIPTIYAAHQLAHSGEPGPVFIEIPVNLQLFQGEVDTLPSYQPQSALPQPEPAQLQAAAELINQAHRPGLFVGWGARHATEQLIQLAEALDAPVATTLQGLSVFPHDHPLHTGFGFSQAAVPAAQNAFADCDCLIAIGTKFSEIATGSFGVKQPAKLIHIDINPDNIGVNYPADIGLQGDSKQMLQLLLPLIKGKQNLSLVSDIVRDKQAYRDSWAKHDSGGRVNPLLLFQALRERLPRDGIAVVDDGNHTYLAAELLPIYQSGGFISPTDFNCMGYSVPAAIGAKQANPDQQVIAIVGDGCFTMTCMEIATASRQQLGIIYFLFNDGELSQIAQAQQIPYNRKPCTRLPSIDFSGVAQAVGAHYLRLDSNSAVEQVVEQAFTLSKQQRPVIVDINIDYSNSTAFTQGAVKTNFSRFDISTKLRFGARALKRKVLG